MSFLRDLALAHQKHEGWYPGSIAYRHNNPGNLRWHTAHKAFGGKYHPRFTIFPTYELGLQALMADLQAKITGHSAHIDYKKNPTFLDYVRVYAPSEDSNDPSGYTQALIRDLAKNGYFLSPQTPLTELARYITGEQAEVMPAKMLLSQTLNLMRRTTGSFLRMLRRKRDRLLEMLD